MNSLSKLSVHSQLTFDRIYHTVPPEVSSLCFSPDGRWLCGVCGGRISIWEMPSGQLTHEFDGFGIAFMPTGELVRVVWVDAKCRVEVLRLPSCEVVCQFEGWEQNIYMVAVSPDGRTIAGGGFKEVHIWDRESRAKLRSFPAHQRITTDVASTTDGKSLVTRSHSDTAVWSLVGDCLATIEPTNDHSGRMAVSSNGTVAITTGQGVELRSLNGERLAILETQRYLGPVAFNVEGDVLAVGSHSQVLLINVESTEVLRVLHEPDYHIAQLAWHPDGSLAAAWSGKIDLWSDRSIGTPPVEIEACADDQNITERLKRIRAKIVKRGLKLRLPAEISEVEDFEMRYGVVLPEGFRRFITEIGNGGEGPPAYDLVSLQEIINRHSPPAKINVPFSLTEACVWESEEEPRRTELLRAAWNGGYLYLGTDGCAMDWMLIVTGAERGHIWNMDGIGAVPVTPRRDFLSWYEHWIDGGGNH